MGIVVICSYKAKPGHEDEAQRLVEAHAPALRRNGLITARPVVRAAGPEGVFVEIFEWESEEKSRSAPAIHEIGEHWKAMAAVMDFVPLASLPRAQQPFAHFTAI
jgi:quinol monooxygenase YgiN